MAAKDKDKKRDEDAEEKPQRRQKLIAKKDFTIHHNTYFREIKEGQNISDVPEIYHENLRTEEVI
jgi:hypothetical protein